MSYWGKPRDLKEVAKEIIDEVIEHEITTERVNFTVTLDEDDFRRLQIILKKVGLTRVNFCETAITNLILAFEQELKLYDLGTPFESEYFKAVSLVRKEDFEKYLSDMPAGLANGEVTSNGIVGGFVYKDGKIQENEGEINVVRKIKNGVIVNE